MAKTLKSRPKAGDCGRQGGGPKGENEQLTMEGEAQAVAGGRQAAVGEALAKAHEGCPALPGSRVTGHGLPAPARCCGGCVYACAVACRRLAEGLGDCARVLVCGNRAEQPGVLAEVAPEAVCRNFKARRDRTPRLPASSPAEPGVCYIALTRGFFAIVDVEDFERVNQYKWCASSSDERAYASRNEGGKMISMHRFLMDPPEGMVVDHIDHNRFNNSRSNMRICTQQQNTYNSRPKGKSSRFKGLCWDKYSKRWFVTIRIPGRGDTQVGRFDDEVEAAKAYDRAAHEVQGPYAYLNFPEDFPNPDPDVTSEDGGQETENKGPKTAAKDVNMSERPGECHAAAAACGPDTG